MTPVELQLVINTAEAYKKEIISKWHRPTFWDFFLEPVSKKHKNIIQAWNRDTNYVSCLNEFICSVTDKVLDEWQKEREELHARATRAVNDSSPDASDCGVR